MFQCRRCGYEFSTKQNLLYHYKKKKPCIVTCEDVSQEECLDELLQKNKEHKCLYCDKTFSYPQGKSRHMKLCNLSDSTKKIIELREQVKTLENSKHIVVNNYNNVLNQQNIINVKSFGQENMDYLSKDFLNSCLLMNNIVPLIENIHFDKEHPENHNVKVKSTKQELMETFVDGKWIITDTDDTLNELINKGYRVLNYHSRKNKNDILETEMDEDEYDDVLSWLEKIYEDKKTRRPIKKQLLLLFLNNKTMLLGKEE